MTRPRPTYWSNARARTATWASDSGVPIEADPADVDEQRREVGDADEDDYR